MQTVFLNRVSCFHYGSAHDAVKHSELKAFTQWTVTSNWEETDFSDAYADFPPIPSQTGYKSCMYSDTNAHTILGHTLAWGFVSQSKGWCLEVRVPTAFVDFMLTDRGGFLPIKFDGKTARSLRQGPFLQPLVLLFYTWSMFIAADICASPYRQKNNRVCVNSSELQLSLPKYHLTV